MNSRESHDRVVRKQLMQWALQRVPEADTAKMLALLGLRKRGLDLAGLSQLLVDSYLNIVQKGADEGVNEQEIVAWLWSALELRVLRPADQ
jgi:hypothetical protein